MENYRDLAAELVEIGLVSEKHMIMALLKYMSNDDVKDMLECNEFPMNVEDYR